MNTQVRQGETLLPLAAWSASGNILGPNELRSFLQQLALQIVALHDQGILHGNLVPAAIGMNIASQPRLVSAAAELPDPLVLDPELVPPEIRGQVPGKLPRNLAAASQALSQPEAVFDARRIDVYQLGALVIQVAAGVSVEDYTRSPLAAARIPADLRPVVDRALGISSAQRLTTCTQLLEELEPETVVAENAERTPAREVAARETPSRGVAISSDTDLIKKQREQARRKRETGELPFERLGSYEIVARLGSGGMGDVFKGYDASLDRFVAIKVLPLEFARQEDFVGRFRAEAAAAAKVEHPNIVPIYTIGSDQDRHFFAMQFVDGQTLGQLLAEQPRLATEKALRIVEQVVSGLAAAHRFGLVHRDIKPGNILLADGGKRALVADFGLVKSIGQDNRMTATGVVMGTVDYISPEQGRGKAVDGRSDLYSVGVLLYQMLAGRLPFSADTPTAMIFQHAYEPPPPLVNAAPQVPPVLAQIVHRLLAKAPAERYQTCEDLLDDLGAFRAGEVPPHLSGAAAGRETGPRTAIILAPKFAEHDLPPEVEPALAQTSRWSWEHAKQYVFFWLKQKAPELVRHLENTQQQVDGAVFEYEQRCESLGRLVREAEAVRRLLEIQFQEHQAAAATARHRLSGAKNEVDREEAQHTCTSNAEAAEQLQQQLGQQREELEAMQLEYAKASARLTRLKSHRDALNARLKVAQARYGLSDGRQQRRTPMRVAIASATALAALVLLALGIWVWRSPPSVKREVASAAKEKTGPETFAIDQPPNRVNLQIDASAQSTTIDETITSMRWMPNPLTTESCNLAIGGASGGIWDVYIYHGRLPTSANRWSAHNNSVTDLAFSPQSQRLATAGKDGNILIWEREPRRLARRLSQGEEVSAVSFSPLGDQLLAGGQSGVRCWDVVSGEEMQRYAEPGLNWSSKSGLAWFPDQSAFILATNTHGSQVSAFLVPSDGSSRKDLAGSAAPLHEIAIFRGGNMIVGQTLNEIWVWDDRNAPFARQFGSNVKCAAYSQWGGHTLTGHVDGSVMLWNTFSGEKLQDVVKLPGEVTAVSMTSRGDLGAASCGRDISTLRIFPLPREKVAGLKRYYHAPKTLRALAFSPYELRVASQDEQNLRVWSLEAEDSKLGSVEGTLPGSSVTYSPDGKRLLVTRAQPDRQGNGPILLSQPRQGLTPGNAQVRRYRGHQGGTNAAVFLRTGTKFVSGGNDSELRIWDVANEQELQHFNVGTPVRALALSRDETQVFAAGDLLEVQAWDLEKQIFTGALKGHSLPVSAVAVAKNADRVVTISADKTARVWDSKTLEGLATFDLAAVPRAVAITPDGSRIVTGGADGVLRCWDVASKAAGPVVGIHNGPVTALCLSVDGQSLASAGEDQLLCWWTLPKK